MKLPNAMNVADPLKLRYEAPKVIVHHATASEIGKRPRQEDAILIEGEECFALADGVGGMPHGDMASHLAVDSAIWTVKLSKIKPYYWEDKRLLGGRVFRSANWRLFNKRREAGFADGMASTLVMLLFGELKCYVYHVGDSGAYRLRGGILKRLTSLDRDNEGLITKALGVARKGPEPSYFSDSYQVGDLFCLATDGILDYVADDQLGKILTSATAATGETTAKKLVAAALEQGSLDNLSCILVFCTAPQVPENKPLAAPID